MYGSPYTSRLSIFTICIHGLHFFKLLLYYSLVKQNNLLSVDMLLIFLFSYFVFMLSGFIFHCNSSKILYLICSVCYLNIPTLHVIF